jgi:hypothetical protein
VIPQVRAVSALALTLATDRASYPANGVVAVTSNTYQVVAGSYFSIAVVAGTVSPAEIAATQARLGTTSIVVATISDCRKSC